jgi:GTPase
MLIDEAVVTFEGGHGGAGKVSYYPREDAGPDGGNGGKGGDIYGVGISDLTALNQFSRKKLIQAPNGAPGSNNRMFGSDGDDLEVKFPIGTALIDAESGERIEINEVGQRVLISKGGLGGRGNFEFKSPRRTTPMYAQPGLPGQKKTFVVSLSLIADFGLIGLPNSGKSSLLNELTKANVKVANYPFTTLEPNLGVLDRKVLADIPGLIEGASEGKGLGIKFLKHIEKVEVLLHCISLESDDLIRDYKLIRAELGNFSKALLDKKEVILLTKSDLVEPKILKEKIKELKTTKRQIIPVSIHNWDSLEELKRLLYS